MKPRLHWIQTVATLGLFVAASAISSTMTFAQQRVGDIIVLAPWSRATPAGVPVGAGYLGIRNLGSATERLAGASFEVAGRVEIHEMTLLGGVMRMRAVEAGVPIAAGQTVSLRPGGLHLMLLNLKRPLAEGERISGTLFFERAGPISVDFLVRDIGAPGQSRAQ